MHRTSNALRLLMSVTALAVCGCVTGCVSVEAGPPHSPPPAPPARQRSHPLPQVVQPPAREALEAVDPTDSPAPAPPPLSGTGPPRAVRQVPRHRAEQPAPRPAAPRTRHPRTYPAMPALGDVCALGQGYGGWRADSPEARICRETYGN
ncbi:hypothetical protein ABR738_07450 [Streptomyces sp. Edi4]|uniref:hypothetical protein n=1 Tax=Streptomyces sp. Edi4 TaxID=3162527 RepID=UPI003305BD90